LHARSRANRLPPEQNARTLGGEVGVIGAWAKRPRSVIRYRRLRDTGLHPEQPRRSRGVERQRLAALTLISDWREEIKVLASLYNISADAIAGVILWDGAEDPYRRWLLRLGPGRVHPCEVGRKSDAKRAEEAELAPFTPRGPVSRLRILRRPEGALLYIAAILAYHAENYETIAGVDIRRDPAILCTLYQGGASDLRAARLARRRARDPGALPIVGDEMGPWVEAHRGFIRGLLERPLPIVAVPAGPEKPIASPRSRAAGLLVWDRLVAACEPAAK
jgi:hypothetical protein